MYESFFGFRDNPFSILPDASFLYLSEKHKLALTVLRYGLDSHALITVITGDIGCGKTTLLRKLMDEVSDDISLGLITNTHSAFGDPLRLALQAFDLDYRDKSKTEQHQILVDFMIEQYARNRRTVLIVDEAQNLDKSALEALRMLSNINVDQHHVLQLVLVGQPELRRVLKQPELKQFAQRVSADYHILPLEADEIAAYIQHRLSVAGGDPQIFLPETYPLIHAHSGGVPRLINILCDTALVHAYGANLKTINTELIQEVISDRESGVYFNNSKTDDKLSESIESPFSSNRLSRVFSKQEKSTELSKSPPTQEVFSGPQDLISDPGWLSTTNERLDSDRQAEPVPPDLVAEQTTMQPATEPEPAPVAEIKNDRVQTPKHTEAESKPEVTASKRQQIEESTNFDSSEELPERESTPSWFNKVAIWVFLAVFAIGGLYIYQNPEMKNLILAKITQTQTQTQTQLPTPAPKPEQDPTWLAEVDKHLKAGQLFEPAENNAYVILQRVLEQEPENVYAQDRIAVLKDQLFSNANKAQTLENWALAQSELQNLLKIEPQSQQAQAMLAQIVSRQEEDQARAQREAQIQDGLSEAEEYLKAGQLVAPEGQNAYAVLIKVLALAPENAEAQLSIEAIKNMLFSKATFARDQGNWNEARGNLQALLEINPGNSHVQEALNAVNKAEEQARIRDAEQAELEAWLDEAEQYSQADQLVTPAGANAYENYAKALEREPDNERALAGIANIKDQLLAKAEIAQGQALWDTARGHLEALLQIEPQNKPAEAAITSLEDAQEQARIRDAEQAELEAWLDEAEQYSQADQLVTPAGANAYENYAKALEREPDNERALAGIANIKDQLLAKAEIAQAQAQWDTAYGHLQALSRIDPQNERAKQARAALELAEETARMRAAKYAQLQNWLALADNYLQADQLVTPAGANAYENYTKALEREPDNERALAGIKNIKDQLLAKAEIAQGQALWDTARGHLEALLQIEPQNKPAEAAITSLEDAQEQARIRDAEQAELEAWLDEAEQYSQADQLVTPAGANAYENYVKALEREPDNERALAGIANIKDQLLAKAEIAQGQTQWDVARGYLEALLQIEPQNKPAQAAITSLEDAQEQARIRDAEQAELQSWLDQADQYSQADQLVTPAGANAYENYAKALEREPDNARALAGIANIKDQLLAKAEIAQGQAQWDKARGHLEALLQIEPQNKPAEAAIALLEEAQEQARIRDADQTELQAWLDEAEQYSQADQLVTPVGANAYENYAKALEREPENERALAGIANIKDQLLAKAEIAQGQAQWDVARDYLEALSEIEPQSQRVNEALAALQSAQMGSTESVVEPNQLMIWLAEADRYLQIGQLLRPPNANAYTVLQNILDQEPNNAKALEGIVNLKDKLYAKAMDAKQQGNKELARSHLWALLRVDEKSKRGREALAAITDEEIEIEKTTSNANQPELIPPTSEELDIPQDLVDFLKGGGEKISE